MGFVASNKDIKKIQSKDFWYDFSTHEKSKYTLGYNCMSALHAISKKHNLYKKKIVYARNLVKICSNYSSKPLIGCRLDRKIKNKQLKKTLFYQPRQKVNFDVIFFLGIIKLTQKQIKNVIKKRIISNLV